MILFYSKVFILFYSIHFILFYSFYSSLSVSESVEWVCTKFDYPNGTVVRSCEQTYTGNLLPNMTGPVSGCAPSSTIPMGQSSGPASRRTQVILFLTGQALCVGVHQVRRSQQDSRQVLRADVHR